MFGLIFYTPSTCLKNSCNFLMITCVKMGRKVLVIRRSHRRCSVRKGTGIHRKTHVLEPLLYAETCAEAYNFITKETLAQVFSCEFCEMFKNTFFNTSGRLLLINSWHIKAFQCSMQENSFCNSFCNKI